MLATIIILTVLDLNHQPITKAPVELNKISALAKTDYGCLVSAEGDKIHVLDSCGFIQKQINKAKAK